MLLLQIKSLWSSIFPPMMTVAAARKLIEDMAIQSIALVTEAEANLESERDRIRCILTAEREANLATLSTMIEKESAVGIIERSIRVHAEETEALLDARLSHLNAENKAALDDLNAAIHHLRATFSKTLLLASTRGSAIVAEAPGLSPVDRRALLEVFSQMHAGTIAA